MELAHVAGRQGGSWLHDKVQELEEQLLLVRQERGEADVRASRVCEQLDRLWQDMADERQERQVEANEERLIRSAEVSELREAVEKLNKATQLDPDLEGPPDFSVLATCLEEELEDRCAPELTADITTRAAARSVEAQLKRVVADARRAEAAVRRELSRALADARAYLESTGQQQQEFWAARQRMAASSAANTKAEVAEASVECLALRLEALELHLRTRLEANERGFDSIQSCMDRLNRMPTHLESLFSQEMESLRQEFVEALQHSQSAGQLVAQSLGSEVEQHVVEQVTVLVREEVATTISCEAARIREEFARSRSDEAYRQALRIQAAEDRINEVERRTADGLAVAPVNEEALAAIEDTLHAWRREDVQLHAEVKAQAAKLNQDFEELSRRLVDNSTADIADLHQRFDCLDEKLRGCVPQLAAGNSEEDAASVQRLKEVLEETEVMKKCVAELMQRFSDGKTREAHSGDSAVQAAAEQAKVTPSTMTSSPTLSWVSQPTQASGSWVAPPQSIQKASDQLTIKPPRAREGSHVPRIVAKSHIASPPSHCRTVVRSVSVPVLQPGEVTASQPCVQMPAGPQPATGYIGVHGTGSMQLQPAVVRAVSPPPSGPSPLAKSPLKPADSPYLRHRPVKIASGVLLPSRPFGWR